MAIILEIADKVVAALNAESWDLQFTAVREYTPALKLTDVDVLHVIVVPATIGRAASSRTEDELDYEVQIGILQRFQHEPGDTDIRDDLVDLAEAIGNHFARLNLTLDSGPILRCIAVANDPIYSPEHMRENRQFTSIITLTFRTWE